MKPANAWQKGQSGNPGGRPRLPDATQRLKETAKIQTIEAISKVMGMNRAEIAEVAKDKTAPAALLLAASVVNKAINLGCPHRAQLILSYVVGKPEQYVEAESDELVNRNHITLAYSKADLARK